MPPLPPTSGAATLTSTTSPLADTFTKALHLRDTHFNVPVMRFQDSADLGHIDGSWQFRTGYTAISLFCMMILALMLGSRAKHLGFNNLKSMNFVRFLVITLYVTAIVFVASTAILQIGIGINEDIICNAGSYMCITFYILNKALMYMFMIERAHSIRAPYTRRLKDYVWCFWMLFSGVGFAVIVVLAFIYPHKGTTPDHTCRLGLPKGVSIALVLYDTGINFSLTAVFIWLIRPLLAFHRTSDPNSKSCFRDRLTKSFNTACGWIPTIRLPNSGGPYHQTVNQSLVNAVEWLVWKTLAGTVLIVMPTIANLVTLTAMGGKELAWVCFTVCTADITWAVCAIHWLTVDPLEVDNCPTARATFHVGTTDQSGTEMSGTETPIRPSQDPSVTELTSTKR